MDQVAVLFFDTVCMLHNQKFSFKLIENIPKELVTEIEKCIGRWVELNQITQSNKKSTKEDSIRVENFREKLKRILDVIKSEEEQEDFLNTFPSWKECRTANIASIRQIAAYLERNRNYVNKATTISNWSSAGASTLHLAKTLFKDVGPWVDSISSICALFHDVLSITTTVGEHISTELNMKDATASIETDQKQSESMKRWLRYNNALLDSIKAAIGDKALKDVFLYSQEFYFRVRDHRAVEEAIENTGIVLQNLLECLKQEGYCDSTAVPFAAALFKIFLTCGTELLSLEWSGAAKYMARLETALKVAGYIGRAYFTSAIESPTVESNKSSTSSTIATTALTVGHFINICRVFQVGSESEQARELRRVANSLEDEFKEMQKAYDTFTRLE